MGEIAHTAVHGQGRPRGGRNPAAMVEASRTLVKSLPELWAELSDPTALARHLEPFGDVRPVDCDGESLVAWEGEHARGRVVLRPSGWGTRVTLEAAIAAPVPAPVPGPRRRGLWARLRRRRLPAAPPQPPRLTDEDALTVLTTLLDALGRAHHRPFSPA